MKFKHLVFTLLSLLVLLLFLFWHLIIEKKQQLHSKLSVVCTTNIIADALHNIAGDHIHLDILMGPGVDPHLYKPIEQDVTKIAQADIIFYNGLHLEARMADMFNHMSKNHRTIAVTENMPSKLLIRSEEHEQFFDPHVWFDPMLWLYAIETITEKLKQHDATHAHDYENNKKQYVTAIQKMYTTTKQQIASIPQKQRILITGHDAFEYFARAYNCQVMSLQGISTASEAGTKDVQDLANFIVKHKIPAIFLETSIPPRNIQAVQQNVASKGFNLNIGDELYSDALGSLGTPEGTYLGMIQHNINVISQALSH